MNLLVAESKEFSPEALAKIARVATVRTADMTRAELLDALHDVDILWVRLRNRIDREVMDAAPQLKILVTNTTGLDHIDLDEAERRGMRVLSLRGETAFLNTVTATAELTIALLLALVRHVPRAAAHAAGGGWDRYPFKGHDLFGKTAGIIGYGRLGRMVGRLLSAFGMRVIVATGGAVPCVPEPGVTIAPLDRLLADADVVTLHVNLTNETHGLIGRREFERMRRGSWFVNTARGALVDEDALVDALMAGQLAGAAVDVVCEPYGPNQPVSPLVRYAADHDNVIITPHIGGYTFESLGRTEVFLAGKLLELLAAPTAA
jgi:D-3-phosphoglycerate dehydrogenase / 2-oxoglutarate reductase